MKVKIRGLVFAGFAAAVFAQSALGAYGDQATYGGTQSTDEKTVTSKFYVDAKLNQPQGYVLTQGTARGTVSSKQLDNTGSSIDTEDPSSGSDIVVTGQAVANAINGLTADLNIVGDIDFHTTRVPIYDDSNPAQIVGYKIIVPDSVVADDGAGNDSEMIAANGSRLTTVSAVMDYSETLTNKIKTDSNGDTTIDDQSSDDEYPSAKNVYEFVTAENAAWQPKVATANETTMYVGKYVPDDPNTDGDQSQVTWDSLATGTYVTGVSSSGVYTIDLNDNQLVGSAANGAMATAATGDVNTTNQDKLTKVSAVVDYAVRKDWGTTNANKTLETNASGVVTAVARPAVPLPGASCETSGVHCALVSTGAGTGQPITYEWTVMAQAQ